MLQPHILRAAVDAIGRLPGFPELAVLDLSCGDGELLKQLAARGASCRGSRYRGDDYIRRSVEPMPAGVAIDEQVDLERPLPYSDGQFDVVVMTEVLEHLTSHHRVIAEIGRIVRPGGHLVFTTPNIQRLHSRWQFFLTGTHKLIRRRVGWDLTAGDLYAYHINPVSFPLMHTLLHQAGLSVTALRFTRFKLRHGFWLALYPLFAAAAWAATRPRRSEPAAHQRGERDLRKWMTHPAMLASEQLLVVAAREANAAAAIRAA